MDDSYARFTSLAGVAIFICPNRLAEIHALLRARFTHRLLVGRLSSPGSLVNEPLRIGVGNYSLSGLEVSMARLVLALLVWIDLRPSFLLSGWRLLIFVRNGDDTCGTQQIYGR